MTNFAYRATEEDVKNVLNSNPIVQTASDSKSIEALASNVFGMLDFDLIEKEALYGYSLEEQTDYANDEIARQLRVMGVLAPLPEVHLNGKTAIGKMLDAALPATSGYEKGFRDALESVSLALNRNCTPAALHDAVQTALDAYGNSANNTGHPAMNQIPEGQLLANGWLPANEFTQNLFPGAVFMKRLGGPSTPFVSFDFTLATTDTGQWIPIHGSVKMPPEATPEDAAMALTSYWKNLPDVDKRRWEPQALNHYYIVPAWSDQAGQCRIVCRTFAGKIDGAASYRATPELWKEAGIMNSRGEIVCLDDPIAFAEMKLDEPLMAGVQYSFPVNPPAPVAADTTDDQPGPTPGETP